MAVDPYEVNRRAWDERARVHRDTSTYRDLVSRLRAGGSSLGALDQHALGDVRGLDVLHLQCHLGHDTLSIARLGARAVGVDFSSAAFVEADVLRLPEAMSGQFDLVYASHGVLCWIGDLSAWARVAASFIAPGGRLVLVERHPLAIAMATDGADGERVTLDWPCLPGDAPIRVDTPGSYAAPCIATQSHERYLWPHGIGEMLQAVIDADLCIERFAEHTVASYASHPGMTGDAASGWRLPEPLHGRYPLSFTLVARKATAPESE
jgi:SAM-dependent methyltransferase